VDGHFFFEPAALGETLYARTHIPRQPRETGVVIVAPIGRERIRICHEMAVLGRDLAQVGYPVLRFDFRGEGESAREFRDSTVETRVEDTLAAAAELRRRTGVRKVALVGLHLGASVAACAATRAGADFLALCDPVTDPQAYVSGLFRTAVFQQSQYFGRATAREKDLRASLAAGGTVTFYGAAAGARLVEELERLDIDPWLREYKGRSAIFYFAPRPAAASALEGWAALLGAPQRSAVVPVVMPFSWATRRRWMPRLGSLATRIVHAIEGDTWAEHPAS
jgi:pimeloyl-ACP methyl ester carboxylesterase